MFSAPCPRGKKALVCLYDRILSPQKTAVNKLVKICNNFSFYGIAVFSATFCLSRGKRNRRPPRDGGRCAKRNRSVGVAQGVEPDLFLLFLGEFLAFADGLAVAVLDKRHKDDCESDENGTVDKQSAVCDMVHN